MKSLRKLASGVLLGAAGMGFAQAAGIFRVGDATQVLHLTDDAQAPSAKLIVRVDAAAQTPGPVAAADSASKARVAHLVEHAARANRLDADLLHAVIATESAYAPRAVSNRGALGLMQLMPATARDYGVTDPFDPHQNVHAGARHLRHLLDRFGQDLTLALAAYNAGAGAVLRHGRVPPYRETLLYVPRVLQHLARLQGTHGPVPFTALRASPS